MPIPDIDYSLYAGLVADTLAAGTHERPGTPGKVSLRYFGANFLHLTDGVTHIAIDPYFTRTHVSKFVNPLSDHPAATSEKIAPNAARIALCISSLVDISFDAFLFSHAHFDHGLDAVAFMQHYPDALVYGNESIGAIVAGNAPGHHSSRFSKIDAGRILSIGKFTVHILEAGHIDVPLFNHLVSGVNTLPEPFPAPWLAMQRGTMLAFLIAHEDHPDTACCIMGSGVCPDAFDGAPVSRDVEKLLGKLSAVSLPVGGYLHLLGHNAEYCSEAAVHFARVKNLYFSHWDNYEEPLFPHDRFVETIEIDRDIFDHLMLEREMPRGRYLPHFKYVPMMG